MNKFFIFNAKVIVVLYMLIDLVCAGAGMGVPVFCILFGFPLGWYITKRICISMDCSSVMFSRILSLSLLAAFFTFVLMIFIWGILGKAIPMLFDPSSDFKNYGHPFILYDPKISFIGWFVLMTVISPVLQLLMTIFASFLTLIGEMKKDQ